MNTLPKTKAAVEAYNKLRPLFKLVSDHKRFDELKHTLYALEADAISAFAEEHLLKVW